MSDQVTYDQAIDITDQTTVYKRQRVNALNRLAAEVRGFLADAPADDPEVKAILRDCDVVEECARILGGPGLRLRTTA